MSDDKGTCHVCDGHGRVRVIDPGTRVAKVKGDPNGPQACPQCGGTGKAKAVPRTK